MSFLNYGSHSNVIPLDSLPYFTAAAAMGQTTNEINLFIKRLDEAFTNFAGQDPALIFKQNANLVEAAKPEEPKPEEKKE